MPESQQQKVTKSFSLEPVHVATIIQVAKDNGNSSESAALRHIIDEWAQMSADSARSIRQPAS